MVYLVTFTNSDMDIFSMDSNKRKALQTIKRLVSMFSI